MRVLNQKGNLDTPYCCTLLYADGSTVFALTSGKYNVMATYSCREKADKAIGLCVDAYMNKEPMFRFPKDVEL